MKANSSQSEENRHYHLPFCLLPSPFITTVVLFSEITQKEWQTSTELPLLFGGCSAKMKSILLSQSFTAESLRADEHFVRSSAGPQRVSVLLFPSLPLFSFFLPLCVCCFPLGAPEVTGVCQRERDWGQTWPELGEGGRQKEAGPHSEPKHMQYWR